MVTLQNTGDAEYGEQKERRVTRIDNRILLFCPRQQKKDTYIKGGIGNKKRKTAR